MIYNPFPFYKQMFTMSRKLSGVAHLASVQNNKNLKINTTNGISIL